jgi:hypothetical protein
MSPNASLIKEAVCGVRVEAVENPPLQKIRYLDKLVEELAKGKPLEKILDIQRASRCHLADGFSRD